MTDVMSAKNSFENALQKIGDKLEDASKLTVITTLGIYTVKVDSIEAVAGETLQLVAKTEMKLDGDVTNQLPKNPNASDGTLVSKELYEYHQQAIRIGLENRAAFMRGIAEILRALYPGK